MLDKLWPINSSNWESLVERVIHALGKGYTYILVDDENNIVLFCAYDFVDSVESVTGRKSNMLLDSGLLHVIVAANDSGQDGMKKLKKHLRPLPYKGVAWWRDDAYMLHFPRQQNCH